MNPERFAPNYLRGLLAVALLAMICLAVFVLPGWANVALIAGLSCAALGFVVEAASSPNGVAKTDWSRRGIWRWTHPPKK